MKDNKFFRDKHNELINTGIANATNSTFGSASVQPVSAYISANATAIAQQGCATGLLAYVPNYSAAIIPSGSMTPTGYSHFWFIAQPGTSSAHLMAYPPEQVSANFVLSAWIPKA